MPFFLLPALVLSEELVLVVAGVIALAGAADAAGHVVDRITTNTPSYSSSSSSSSTTTTTTCFEQKTIYDWWCNGLDSCEREILLENGYSDKNGCFSLEELKIRVERLFADKAPGKPTEKDGYVPDRQKGTKVVKNPNGKGKGWLDKKGNVWVPNDKGHGGPHWEVQAPNGDHWHVYPDGKVRTH